METSKETIIKYFNNRLEHYKKHLKDHNARIRTMMEMLDFHDFEGKTVLDVGCGVGVFSKYFAEKGASVKAVDIAPDLIEYAKDNNNHSNIQYVVQDVLDFISEEKFDFILFSDVLEHIPEQDIFRIILRLTKSNAHKNTMIIMELPDASFIAAMEKYYPEKLQIIDNGYSVDHIVSLMEYCGFVPARIFIFGVDVDVQYNRYVFSTKEYMDGYYNRALGEIYNRQIKQ